MTTRIHNTFVAHLDPEASLAFYRDAIGLEVRVDVGYEDMRWITMGSPDQPDTAIVLHPPFADPGITEDERRTITEMMAKGTYGMVVFASDDLDAAFAQATGAGAEVVEGPTEQQWGVRDCSLRDPAGNMVKIQEIR
jgi:catechol 2,3-dioxygenase-like lactoylglutathione lyase family enzyme